MCVGGRKWILVHIKYITTASFLSLSLFKRRVLSSDPRLHFIGVRRHYIHAEGKRVLSNLAYLSSILFLQVFASLFLFFGQETFDIFRDIFGPRASVSLLRNAVFIDQKLFKVPKHGFVFKCRFQ